MTDERSSGRKDVVRMLARYVLLRDGFGPRSAAGRLVIDETRAPRKSRGGECEIDIMSASWVEIVDAARNDRIRTAVTAAPERRTDVRLANGEVMRAVAPLRAIAQVVRPRPRRRVAAEAAMRSSADWVATVGKMLKRIPLASEAAVIRVEEIRLELVEIRNKLQAARSDLGRLRGGGKHAQHLRRQANDIVTQRAAAEATASEELKRLVRTKAYRDGLDMLCILCTATDEIRTECFREKR